MGGPPHSSGLARWPQTYSLVIWRSSQALRSGYREGFFDRVAHRSGLVRAISA